MPDRLISPRMALAAGLLGAITITGAGLAVFKPFGLGTSTTTSVRLIELIGTSYPLDRTIDALAAPEVGAPTLTRVRQGIVVKVNGIVEGDGWYQIELPNQQLAYVQVGAIPAAGTGAAEPAVKSAKIPAAEDTTVSTPGLPGAPATAAQAATEPSRYAADVPPPNAENQEPPTVVVAPVTQFDSANDIASVARPTSVYLKPSLLAPQAYPVEIGRLVYIIAESRDGNWAWVSTADNAAAYIPRADLAR